MNWVKNTIKKIPDRFQSAILFCLAAIFISAVFGLFMGGVTWFAFLFTDTETPGYWFQSWIWAQLCFCIFGGFLVVSGIVSVIISGPEKTILGFGAGLYYGTYFMYSFLKEEIIASKSLVFAISVAIVSLVCYVVWLRKNKKQEE